MRGFELATQADTDAYSRSSPTTPSARTRGASTTASPRSGPGVQRSRACATTCRISTGRLAPTPSPSQLTLGWGCSTAAPALPTGRDRTPRSGSGTPARRAPAGSTCTWRMNGSGPQVNTWTSSRQRHLGQIHEALPGAVVRGVDGLVPGVGGEVVDLASDVQDRLAQRMVLRRPVGVRDDDLALRLGPGDVLHDRQHRGDPGARARQQERAVGGLDDEVAGRGADVEEVADGDLVVQERRDLTVRSAVHARHPTHGDLQPGPQRRRGDGVLPGLPVAVRAGRRTPRRTVPGQSPAARRRPRVRAPTTRRRRSPRCAGPPGTGAPGAPGRRPPAGTAGPPRRPAAWRTASRPRSRRRRPPG